MLGLRPANQRAGSLAFARKYPCSRSTRSSFVNQQSASTAYRRGIEEKAGQKLWQKHWHFNEKCLSYPTRNFAVRKDRPSDSDLCSQCDRAD